MDNIENKLNNLINGTYIDDNDELCDFTLQEQNEAAAAKGVAPLAPSKFVPVIKENVTYIVMGVLFNSEGDVLLMQEAKRSCAGQWYLPAGRMERDETIEEALKREVLEETGLVMRPTSLIMIECASKAWFRFVLTGTVVSGTLKTPAQADAESLQAKWVKDISEMSLRANDILPIIERGRSFLKKQEPQHSEILPSLKTHSKLLLRLIVCIKKKSSNRVLILLSEKTEAHFPMCEINHLQSLHSTLRKFMVDIFGADVPPHKPHGIICVEHQPKTTESVKDGLCLTLLVSFRVPLEEVFPIDKYTWFRVSKELGDALLSLMPRNMTIPLNVIR
ncbi:8-oxo-dGDP phosphatase NUDT18 [Cimex lectularius]|uniref:Nudix hydrolase domain-containing protein n=1 Tax=Cimex lectularius TaxID=79782 RepID=A0A8I6S570_CIMLE|nr:8-oxo-dGDP phosphatase NUDT18 [Cimex lectularius]